MADTIITDASAAADKSSLLRVDVSPAQAAWLERFWIPTQLRRQRGAVSIKVVGGTTVEVAATDAADESKFREKWTRLLEGALNKLCEESLGAMNAPELVKAINEIVNTNTGNTGIADVTALEEKLSVLVYFDCTDGPDKGNVTLLGAKKKLENKCADLRSILSHYHWRLSGKDVIFDAMVAT